MSTFWTRFGSSATYDAPWARGTLGLLICNACWFICGFLVPWLLPARVFGEYQFYFATLALMEVFSLPGGAVATVQSVARGYDGTLAEVASARLRYSLAGSVVLLAAGGFYYWRGSGANPLCFVILGVGFPFFYSFNVYSSYLLAKDRSSQMARYLCVNSLAVCAVILALAQAGYGVPWLLAGAVATNCGVNLPAYWLVRREVPAQAKRDPEVLHFARHMTLNGAIPLLALHADKLLLFWFFGDEALAAYVIAVMIPEYTINVSDSARFALLPEFTRQAQWLPWRVVRRQFAIVLVIGAIAALACAAVMPWVLHVFFGGKYDHAARLAQLASLGLAAGLPQKLFQVCLESRKAVAALHRLQLTAVAAKYLLFVALVPGFQLWGAVWAVVGMRAALLGYSWYLVRGFCSTPSPANKDFDRAPATP